MVSRRALLGTGVLLLAGCGPPEEPEVDARAVWREQYEASLAASRAYLGVDDALAERARERASRAGEAYVRAGGSVEGGSFVPASPGDGSLTFFAVLFSDARIASVRILTGDSAPGPDDDDLDIVMMDDFIYGEPRGQN